MNRMTRLLGLLLLPALLLAAGGLSAPSASAANIAFSQCNGFASGGIGGATTAMACDITIVNTINGANRSSTLTVTRSCAGGVTNACPAGGNTGAGNTASVTTSSSNLITTVNQCNGSANGAAISAPPIQCTVRITNNISADTPGARTPATLNQCNRADGSSANGGGGAAANLCVPALAQAAAATVTQCDVAGEGGGGTVECRFTLNSNASSPLSKVSSALPISINQCNNTGNPGGSYVKCDAFITTNITPAVVPTPTATATASPSPTATVGGVTDVPTGGVDTGGGSTAGMEHQGWLVTGGLLAASSLGLLALRRRTYKV